jgi:hypothetical protein
MLIRHPEGKSPFEKLGCRWGDNIKTDFKEVLCETEFD